MTEPPKTPTQTTSAPRVISAPAGGGGMKMPPIDQLKNRPLGRVLIKMGRLTREQVHQALAVQAEQQKNNKARTPIGQIMVDLGLISDKDRNIALAAQQGLEVFDLEGRDIPSDVISKVTPQMATSYKVVPVEFNAQSRTLKVAVASAENTRVVDDLRSFLGLNVVAVIADADGINKILAKHYGAKQESLGDLMSEISSDDSIKALEGRGESIDLETLKDLAESNPVKRLLNMVLLQAIKDKASDIHFEPFEEEFKMRYRIDGVLYEMVPPPKHIAMAITSRIKVMANLDIAERRLPQDGRIELVVNNAPVDLRVSVLPTMFGESVVMRILDRSTVSLDLERVGLREDDHAVFSAAGTEYYRG